MDENRETSSVSRSNLDRSGKPQSRTPDMHAGEESDRAVIAMKPPNQEAQASAEVAEKSHAALLVIGAQPRTFLGSSSWVQPRNSSSEALPARFCR